MNKIHDAFNQIEASEELRSSTMQFLQTERERRSHSQARRPVWRQGFAVVCTMMVLLVGIGGFYTMQTPVSYISIDVNPSVELALNCYDRVVSVTAYNDDGKIVLDGINVRNKIYTDAIDIIVSSDAMQPYLTEDYALTFTVASDNSEREDAIMNGIENCSGCKGHGGWQYAADVTSIKEAHECGLSFGKYSAYQVLSQYDSTITADDCREMSMSEIHRRIKEYEDAGEYNGDGSGNGDGHGNGDGGEHETEHIEPSSHEFETEHPASSYGNGDGHGNGDGGGNGDGHGNGDGGGNGDGHDNGDEHGNGNGNGHGHE